MVYTAFLPPAPSLLRQFISELEGQLALAERAVQASSTRVKECGSPSLPAVRIILPKAAESSIAEGLRQMAGRVGLGSRGRLAVMKYQLESLEDLAAPAYARFLVWLMMQVGLIFPLASALSFALRIFLRCFINL